MSADGGDVTSYHHGTFNGWFREEDRKKLGTGNNSNATTLPKSNMRRCKRYRFEEHCEMNGRTLTQER